MSVIIGIDLGTTNSVSARMTDDGPKLIPNALDEVLTPSVVGIDEKGTLLVGRAAKELQVVAPERCAAVFKLSGKLIEFCLDQQLSPQLVAACLDGAEQEFYRPPRQIVEAVAADWPLHYAYRAMRLLIN